MLSTLTIVSIFIEIFSAGILFASVYTFLERYFSSRKRKDLYLVFLLLFFSLYVALTITGEMMYNVGRSLTDLIILQKFISSVLIVGSLFIWLFIVEKFELFTVRALKMLTYIFAFLCAVFLVRIGLSSVSLVFRADVIEPVVAFSSFIPVREIWAAFWGVFFCMYFWKWTQVPKGRKRNLLLLSSLAGGLFVLAYAGFYTYIKTGETSYLLSTWILTLFGTIGLYIGEGIPPESVVAEAPLRLFRTRILYKLMLIFVLLIVILLETTTLATLNISKRALSQTILSSYTEIASGIAGKVADLVIMQKQVSKVSRSGLVVYIVDEEGKLLVHPDRVRALSMEDMTEVTPVKKVILGQSGGSEFYNKFGDRVVGAYVPIPEYGWGVVVEKPIRDAYFEIRQVETNSLIFIIVGIILTVLTGIFFARSIEKPIRNVITGADAVGKGDLNYRITIDSIDEIGQLASAFNKMTADLKDTQEHLVTSEKLAALGTMAAGMAHEIKNPLVSLRTFTQLLQQKWTDEEYRKKFSAIVPQEIERINRIAESLLKFGRPIKPELTKVNVNEILDEVVSLFENECRKKNIRVTTKFAELPEITGDPGQLSQAFINIVLNAVQVMEEGGELIIKTDVGEVIRLGPVTRQGFLREVAEYKEVSFGEEKEVKPTPVVFVEITDTGPGIPEENLRSLFDPFFTTKVAGTGMGLPITLRIIEDLGGSIKVRSQVGKGTTFIVTLPQKFKEVSD